jgi:hypothetical protein
MATRFSADSGTGNGETRRRTRYFHTIVLSTAAFPLPTPCRPQPDWSAQAFAAANSNLAGQRRH